MKLHYVQPEPLNATSRGPSVTRSRRARKQPLSAHHLTFSQLIATAKERAQRDNTPSPSLLPNLRTALEDFLRERALTHAELVGSVLRVSYYRNLSDHLQALALRGELPSYLRNRKYFLGKWRQFLVQLDREQAARDGISLTPLQSALEDILATQPSMSGLAKLSGVPTAFLRRLRAGSIPSRNGRLHLTCMERHLALPPGSLLGLLPVPPGTEHAAGSADDAPLKRTAYSQRLARHRKEEGYRVQEPHPALRVEWMDLLVFKTSHITPHGMQRQAKGVWRSRPKEVVRHAEQRWFAWLDGEYVPTAGVAWSYTCSFLGWLAAAPAQGGAGLPAERAQTLAHIADPALVQRFLRWQEKRSDGIIHGGHLGFLRFMRSMVHPTTGYLTQVHHLLPADVCGDSDLRWRERCAHAHRAAGELLSVYAGKEQKSRNPFAGLSAVLDLPDPLAAVADAVRRMDAQRPVAGGQTEALWARDRLLLKLLTSNPLRALNIKMLTCLPDGTGHLRKVAGKWRIVIPRHEFKNFAGAARDRNYDMLVREEVWPDIERYLRHYRPQLAHADNPYLFVSSVADAGPWHSLNRHVEKMTRRYFPGCVGAGPHVFRHLVATSILKRDPNAWEVAAWALHDREETVRKSYSHLRSDDAARWLDPFFSETMGKT